MLIRVAKRLNKYKILPKNDYYFISKYLEKYVFLVYTYINKKEIVYEE